MGVVIFLLFDSFKFNRLNFYFDHVTPGEEIKMETIGEMTDIVNTMQWSVEFIQRLGKKIVKELRMYTKMRRTKFTQSFKVYRYNHRDRNPKATAGSLCGRLEQQRIPPVEPTQWMQHTLSSQSLVVICTKLPTATYNQ